MKFFLSYNWPGNVRELKNLIKRAVLLSDSEYISSSHLSLNNIAGFENKLDSSDGLNSFEDASKAFQRDLIKNAIEKAEGNKIKAAKILQINRKALYRKMKSLNLL